MDAVVLMAAFAALVVASVWWMGHVGPRATRGRRRPYHAAGRASRTGR